MTFGLQTLFALTTSLALVLTCVRSTEFGVALMVFVLPFTLMIIGITSPQLGNRLDPSKRWYFFVILKTWVFTLCGLIVLTLIFTVSPYLRDRFVRGLKGDTRRHQIAISFPGDQTTGNGLKGKRLMLHDSKGLVGEIRDVGCTESLQSGKLISSRIWLLVSTDREDALGRNRKQFNVDIRPDGSLYITD